MRLVILKDGTVPVAVAKVVMEDGDVMEFQRTELEHETVYDVVHQMMEVFEVADSSEYVFIGWRDGMGFDVVGFRTLDYALDMLNTGATREAIESSYLNDGHWAITYDPGDDESYGHVVKL